MTRYQPDLVNQFNRLIPSVGKTYDLGSAWNNVRVINGIPHDFDAENCMATLGAIAGDAHTAGVRQFSPASIRNNQYDFTGGIGHDDVQVAFARLGLHPFLDEPTDWPTAMDYMRQGRFVWFAVDYGKVPWAWQAQKGGKFAHAMGGCNPYADGSFDGYDSLARKIARMPQYAMRAAAEAIAIKERHDKRQLFVGATAVMPVIDAPSDVTFRYGGTATGRGRFLLRSTEPYAYVYDRPSKHGQRVATMRSHQSFACAQTTMTGEPFKGSRVWRGTKDGKHWIQAAKMWFAGHSNGNEDVR